MAELVELRTDVSVCTDCRREFRKKGDYNRHRTRLHERPFQCPICQHRFGLKLNLERHQVLHLKDTFKWRCSFPGCKFKGTPRKDYLWAHVRDKHATSDTIALKETLRKYCDVGQHSRRLGEVEVEAKRLELLVAVQSNDVTKAQAAIAGGADITCLTSNGESLCEVAAAKGFAELFEILLFAGRRSKSSHEEGNQKSDQHLFTGNSMYDPHAISSATLNCSHKECLQARSRHFNRANNYLDSNLFKPLSCAAENGHTDVMQIILDHGTTHNIAFKSQTLQRALKHATQRGQEEAVDLLLKYMEINRVTVDILSLQLTLEDAIADNNAVNLRLLLDYSTKDEVQFEIHSLGYKMVDAARNGHTDVVRLLLTSSIVGMSYQGKDFVEHAENAVREAARFGYKTTTRVILDHLVRYRLSHWMSIMTFEMWVAAFEEVPRPIGSSAPHEFREIRTSESP